MKDANFWIITIIVCALVATCLTQVIMKPIKKRRSDRQWAQWKEQNEVLKPGYW